MNKFFDITAGNEKVAALDALEAARIAEIRSTPNMDLSDVSVKKILYVSPNGNDTSCGRSPACAVKTIARAMLLSAEGDYILLERGGYWREKVIMLPNRTLSAYGEGKKPIISGSPENGADPAKWTLDFENPETGVKIWKFANENMTDVGSIFFDGGDDFSYKGYAKKDMANCKAGVFTTKRDINILYDYRTELENLTFFHKADSIYNDDYIATDIAVGPLYLRCDAGNPGELYEQIEFNTKGHTIAIRGDGITIDNITIVHTGSHGIGAGTVDDLTITNCEIGWIGGSLQSYARGDETGSAFRYGNGVEIYGGCHRYTIENCYVYQCYDAGITHQYSFRSRGNCVMEDVLYKNNVITDCVYNIEYFHSEYEGYIRTGENILFEGNLLRRAGWGFGSTRPDKGAQGNIRSGGSSNPFKNFVIRDNVFDRSVAYLVQCETQAEEYIPKMEGNTYIQGVGNRLCHFGVPTQRVNVDDDIDAHITGLLRDTDAKVYFVEHIGPYEFREYSGKKA